ncbi:twin-arginine translocation signal domain-containing protein [Kribbella kalugense]|uniref:Secreted protein n=1 Tax=Kribbella kalugense TaxID=2512221 RepID=A0A4R7ZV76_9ACTN|nr:twin-arginine translocation signal domain-containing protein [Kribbella kalugense]TDW22007.1 secreted protein [Kribbella kalugense]
MSDATRRGFLVFAGAGTAAAVGAVAAPKIFDRNDGEPAGVEQMDLANAESFVVHVKDVRRGELAIMVGQREVLVVDRELAARLAGVTATA